MSPRPRTDDVFMRFVATSSRGELLSLALAANLLLWLGVIRTAQTLTS